MVARREGFEPPAFWSVGCPKEKAEPFRLRFALFNAIWWVDFPLFPSGTACSYPVLGQKWVKDDLVITNWKHFLAKHIRVRKYCGFISFAPLLSIRMPKISAQKMVFSKLRSTKWSVLACKDMMREGNHLISTLSSLYYAFVLTEYLHFAWLCVWGTVLVIFMWQHKIWYAISKEKTEAPRIARGPGGLFTFAV